jgi:hypothetical protein
MIIGYITESKFNPFAWDLSVFLSILWSNQPPSLPTPSINNCERDFLAYFLAKGRGELQNPFLGD